MQGDIHSQHSNPRRKATAQLTPVPLQTRAQSDSEDDDVPLALACKRTHLSATTAGAALPRPATAEPLQIGVVLSTDAPLPESRTPAVAVPAIVSEPSGEPEAIDTATALPVTVAPIGLPAISVAAAAVPDSQYVMSDTAAGIASAPAAAGTGAVSEAASVDSEPPVVAVSVLGTLTGSILVPLVLPAPTLRRDTAEAVPSVRIASPPLTAEVVAGDTPQQASGFNLGNSSAHAGQPLDCTTNGLPLEGVDEGVAATPSLAAKDNGALSTTVSIMSSKDAVESTVGAQQGRSSALHAEGASNLTVLSNPSSVVSGAVGRPFNVVTNSRAGHGLIIRLEPTACGPVRPTPFTCSVSDLLILPDSEDDPDI